MKKLTSTFLSLALLAVTQCQAAVVTFEDLTTGPFYTPSVDILGVPIFPPSGYDSVAAFTGSSMVAFNPNEESPSKFFLMGGGTFNLNSFVIAGAWGAQTLTIEGLLGGLVVDTQSLAVSINAQLNTLNWLGIDTLRITTGNDFVRDGRTVGDGKHWALDNLTFNEVINTVPEPTTLVLVGTALLFVARSRKV